MLVRTRRPTHLGPNTLVRTRRFEHVGSKMLVRVELTCRTNVFELLPTCPTDLFRPMCFHTRIFVLLSSLYVDICRLFLSLPVFSSARCPSSCLTFSVFLFVTQSVSLSLSLSFCLCLSFSFAVCLCPSLRITQGRIRGGSRGIPPLEFYPPLPPLKLYPPLPPPRKKSGGGKKN